MDIQATLERLSGLQGPSGYEHPVAEAAVDLMRPLLDEANVDRFGNAVGRFERISFQKNAIPVHDIGSGYVACTKRGMGQRGFRLYERYGIGGCAYKP